MRTNGTLLGYFDQLAQTYVATQRLSPSCAASIVKAILNEICPDKLSLIVDIGCGDAYLSSLLLRESESVRCILVDISSAMLERARQRLSSLSVLDRALLIRADAGAVPLRSGSVAVVFMAFVLHLLPDPVLTLNVVGRIIAPGGRFFLITYDPDDLASHIYNRYFPGYREIESQRFVPITELVRLLKSCGFVSIGISRYSYEIRFPNANEVVHMVKRKPFSAFANYTDKVFADSLEKFELNLQQHFGQREVVYESKVTFLSMLKPSGDTA